MRYAREQSQRNSNSAASRATGPDGTWHTGSLILFTSQPNLVWLTTSRRGRRAADELAGPTGTHAPSLYRLMRTLANLGILTEDATHRFALTPLGDALKTGAPGSARATILTIASDWWVRGFGAVAVFG